MKLSQRFFSMVVLAAFISTSLLPYQQSYAAQNDLGLPQPGAMVNLSSAYVPLLMKGLRIHPENPMAFDFIMDTGDTGLKSDNPRMKEEANKLIKYFLATLTIPEQHLWVNLSPYEKDRMINDALGQTELGRDMLAQDYVLKQITASMIYPEKEMGRKFWDKVYAQVAAKHGNAQVPVNTFNKVWVLPDRAKVYVKNNVAYVIDGHFKVMLEEDYLAKSKQGGDLSSPKSLIGDPQSNKPSTIASSVVREIVLPALEKEVNEGKNFAPLRQIFYSLVLASWYKKHLKDALLNQVYADKSKVDGVNVADPTLKNQIYQKYIEAYKKGVFNYIKEDARGAGKQQSPRKYFSGGQAWDNSVATSPTITGSASNRDLTAKGEYAMVGAAVEGNVDAAMKASNIRRSELDNFKIHDRQHTQLDIIAESPRALVLVAEQLAELEENYKNAMSQEVESERNAIYLSVMMGVQDLIELPHLFVPNNNAMNLRARINELWIKTGNAIEMGRVRAINDMLRANGVDQKVQKEMGTAQIVFNEGKPSVQTLPADKWAPYSAPVWAPYLNDSLVDLILSTPIVLNTDGSIDLSRVVFDGLQLNLVQALAKETTPDARLKEFVKLEGDVRKDPALALRIAKDLQWKEIKTSSDLESFLQNFLTAMKWMKWIENWRVKKDRILSDASFMSVVDQVRSKLNDQTLTPETLAARITALNIPINVIEQVVSGKMEKADKHLSDGRILLNSGHVRMVSMAGGSASRWKDSLKVLIEQGLVDPKETPDGLPRALAAYWVGNYQEGGQTGVSLMFNNLSKELKQSNNFQGAFVLSPYTWEAFMRSYWDYFKDSKSKPRIDVMVQNPGSAQVIKDGVLTDENIEGKVLGHGNVRGWMPGIIQALKRGVVFDITRSADNPFLQLDQPQSLEIIGMMANKGLAHVALGNWRSIGQAGGGFVNQNGIPDLIDTPISKSENAQGFMADRDINIFSAFSNFINNAAVLYAVSRPEDNLISWPDVLNIGRGDRNALEQLKGRLSRLSIQDIDRLTTNFINLLPSEFVLKKEGNVSFVQWEQISGMLHGALPKAIKERQQKEGISSGNLNMAYVDISLSEHVILQGAAQTNQTIQRVPTFVEVKGAPDLISQRSLVSNLYDRSVTLGVFKGNVDVSMLGASKEEILENIDGTVNGTLDNVTVGGDGNIIIKPNSMVLQDDIPSLKLQWEVVKKDVLSVANLNFAERVLSELRMVAPESKDVSPNDFAARFWVLSQVSSEAYFYYMQDLERMGFNPVQIDGSMLGERDYLMAEDLIKQMAEKLAADALPTEDEKATLRQYLLRRADVNESNSAAALAELAGISESETALVLKSIGWDQALSVKSISVPEALWPIVLASKPGTSGVRGKTGANLDTGIIDFEKGAFNIHVIGLYARAFAEVFKKKGLIKDGQYFIVVNDARPGSDVYMDHFARVLRAYGVDVRRGTSEATTPSGHVLSEDPNAVAVINGTASHNPITDNGFKFSRNGVVADDEIFFEVFKTVASYITNKTANYDIDEAKDAFKTIDPVAIMKDKYTKEFSDLAREINAYVSSFDRPIEIIYDTMHGTAGVMEGLINQLLPIAKVTRTELLSKKWNDDAFRNKRYKEGKQEVPYRPEPKLFLIEDQPDYQRFVKEAPIGSLYLAIDGDADRLMILIKTKDGIVELSPNHLGFMLGKFQIDEIAATGVNEIKIAKTLPTSYLIESLVEYAQKKYGLKATLVETPVGSKYFGPSYKEGILVIGVEESGHIVLPKFFDDGVAESFALLRVLAKSPGKTINDVLNDMLADAGKVIGKDLTAIVNNRINLPYTDKAKAFFESTLAKGNIDPVWQAIIIEFDKLKQEIGSEIEGVYLTQEDERKQVESVEIFEYRNRKKNGTNKPLKVNEGFKIKFLNGAWAMIRISGTEGVIRLYAEAFSQEQYKALNQLVANIAGIDAALAVQATEKEYEDDNAGVAYYEEPLSAKDTLVLKVSIEQIESDVRKYLKDVPIESVQRVRVNRVVMRIRNTDFPVLERRVREIQAKLEREPDPQVRKLIQDEMNVLMPRFNALKMELLNKHVLLPGSSSSGGRYRDSQLLDKASISQAPGGIDLSRSDEFAQESGESVRLQFDAAQVAEFKKGNFTGVRPVILSITMMPSILPLFEATPRRLK